MIGHQVGSPVRFTRYIDGALFHATSFYPQGLRRRSVRSYGIACSPELIYRSKPLWITIWYWLKAEGLSAQKPASKTRVLALFVRLIDKMGTLATKLYIPGRQIVHLGLHKKLCPLATSFHTTCSGIFFCAFKAPTILVDLEPEKSISSQQPGFANLR